MPSTTSKRTIARTSRSTSPIEDPASDEFMIKHGFRLMTAKERAESRKFFPCADHSNDSGAKRQ
jgi:hypothetical protein